MDMRHPYKTREGGATVTIFVPYDCKNHLPLLHQQGRVRGYDRLLSGEDLPEH